MKDMTWFNSTQVLRYESLSHGVQVDNVWVSKRLTGVLNQNLEEGFS